MLSFYHTLYLNKELLIVFLYEKLEPVLKVGSLNLSIRGTSLRLVRLESLAEVVREGNIFVSLTIHRHNTYNN